MSQYETAHSHLVLVVCIASLVGVLWTMFIFTRTPNRHRYLPHNQTFILLIFQTLASTGRVVDVLVEKPVIAESWRKYLFYLITMIGYYGTCINTALLGVAIYIITSYNTKFVLKISVLLNLLGMTAPCVLCGITSFWSYSSVKHHDTFKSDKRDFPILAFPDEYCIIIEFLILCSLTTMVSMIISERQYKKNRASKNEILGLPKQKISEIDEKLGFLRAMDSKYGSMDCIECRSDNKETVCRFKVGSYHLYHYKCQIVQHTFLLICLTFCMLVGKLLKRYKLNNKDETFIVIP